LSSRAFVVIVAVVDDDDDDDDDPALPNPTLRRTNQIEATGLQREEGGLP
jgi:hypothetical protein